jgi:TonB family protein
MKYSLLSLIIFISHLCYCQSPETNSGASGGGKIFQVVEHMPEFPGGDNAMMIFLQKNIKYPNVERENDIEGRVVVGFIVNEDGSLSDIAIKKSASPGFDAEAVRVVKLFPKFKPGTQQGKAVRVSFVLPIKFTLAGGQPAKKKDNKKP